MTTASLTRRLDRLEGTDDGEDVTHADLVAASLGDAAAIAKLARPGRKESALERLISEYIGSREETAGTG